MSRDRFLTEGIGHLSRLLIQESFATTTVSAGNVRVFPHGDIRFTAQK